MVIDHGDNYCALYLHLDKWYVKARQLVQQGEWIGLSGNRGQSSGPHLHVAVFRKTGGGCQGAGAGTEVMMLFDELPKRELKAGDWIVSQNGKPYLPYYPSLVNVTSNSITVQWNDYANNELGFRIERRMGKGAWSEIATLGENAISYLSNGLNPATQYCYRVRAFNQVGNSAYSNIVCATTRPADSNSSSASASSSAPPDDNTNVSESPAEEAADPAPSDNGKVMLYNAALRVRTFFESLGLMSSPDDEDSAP